MSWLTSLPAEFVRCRKLGHAWLDGGSSYYRVGRSFTGLELRCERCTMVRRDLFDPRGELAARRYVQPDGYKKPPSADRPFGFELTKQLVSIGSVEPTTPAMKAMMTHLIEAGRT